MIAPTLSGLRPDQTLRVCWDCRDETQERTERCLTCRGEGDVVISVTAARMLDTGAADLDAMARCLRCEMYEIAITSGGLCEPCRHREQRLRPQVSESTPINARHAISQLERVLVRQQRELIETDRELEWARSRLAEIEAFAAKAGGR